MKTIKFHNFLQVILLAGLIAFLSACSKQLIGPDAASNPVSNFDHLWGEYDRLYGAFGPKKIDWNAVYQKYRPQINDNMTDAELLKVTTQMLDVLDDNHVYLRPLASTNLPWYSGGILGRTTVEDYNGDVVKTYLSETKTYGNDMVFGKLKPTVGYLLLKGFENDIAYYPKAMDEVLTYMKDLKGIVIDLRDNGGGEDRVSQYIANRFASEKHLSFTVRGAERPEARRFWRGIAFLHRTRREFSIH
jgi:carboxyl-terminal processing protease